MVLQSGDPAHVALTSQDLFQLYQALDFLHPLPMAAAQQLQEMVARLGPFPLSDEMSAADLSSHEHLCAALGQLGLAFSANVPLSGYQAAAVLQPRDSVTVPVVLVTKAVDHFRNQHHRLTGRAMFKQTLLAKHGKLILIPQSKLSSSIDELAAYLQQELEAAVGGSLDPYCC
ncbi:TPA: hypothetical protein ACH3X3_009500 [Trebouxia sp. C0006]